MKTFSFVIVSFIAAIFALTLGQMLKPYYDTIHQVMIGLIVMFISGMIMSIITEAFMKTIRKPTEVEKTKVTNEKTAT